MACPLAYGEITTPREHENIRTSSFPPSSLPLNFIGQFHRCQSILLRLSHFLYASLIHYDRIAGSYWV